MSSEQVILRYSIGATICVAFFGIAFGVLSGSSSIIFDGVYALADASMSALALLVAGLIASESVVANHGRRLRDRFTMGFWHLEPMVLGLNGVLLMTVATYALINAVGSILAGGRHLEFGFAIVYAAVTLIACTAMALVELRANRRLRSDFIKLDAQAWLMSGAISAALLLAFCAGYAVQGTSYAWASPYIDPAVLAMVCLIIIPLPFRTVKQAFADILLVAPDALRRHVDTVAATAVQKHGFIRHHAYVAKVGRARQIEIHFVVPPTWAPKNIVEIDHIRDEIGIALGDEGPDRWLTVAFTADPEWAA